MIDFVIPTYNSQHTIKRCLNSVLKICDFRFNIILVDDGSIDTTRKINKYYSLRYKNIYSYYQNHKGVSAARNLGMKHSNSKWICFIDSDDYINTINFSKIVKKYLFLKKNKVDLIISDININNKNKRLIQNNKDTASNFLRKFYPFYGNEVIHVVWNKIYNNVLLKNYHIKFPIGIAVGEDLIFNLRFFKHINNNVIQTQLSYYYYHYSLGDYNYDALEDESLILKNIKSLCLNRNISLKAMNFLRLKSIYSIFLNELNNSKFSIYNLKTIKKRIKNIEIFHIIGKFSSYKRFESIILYILYKQPFNIIFYVSLIIINAIRIDIPRLWEIFVKL